MHVFPLSYAILLRGMWTSQPMKDPILRQKLLELN
jgi:hypothetical protein